MNKSPLVSICVPTFNGEKYLPEALDSIKTQSYSNIEVVFSDDASTDRTLDLIEDFKKSVDFPVRIVAHTPSGIGANWNNCIEHSSADFIKFLFQDDVLKPTCVEVLVKEISRHPKIGLVYCRKTLIGISDQRMQIVADETFVRFRGKSSSEILGSKELFEHPRNKIGEPPCVLLRKEVFAKSGLFDERLKQSLDYEFWYRVFKHFDHTSVNESLVEFRIHNDQTTQNNRHEVLVDRWLLPRLLLKEHKLQLHFQVKIKLTYKFVTGWIAYQLSRLLAPK